jgi:hypothetical protein
MSLFADGGSRISHAIYLAGRQSTGIEVMIVRVSISRPRNP